jgi:hypothetical protein
MKRRNYITTVVASLAYPLASPHEVRASADEDEHPTLNEIKADSQAFVKRYDVGTIISVAVPKEVDALSITTQIETDGDQLDYRYIDSAKHPHEEIDGKNVWHILHQYPDANHDIHINFSGQRESIEVEKVQQNILGNPWIDFLHDKTRRVGEVNYATIKIVDDDSVQLGFELDSEYDELTFDTFDWESEEWVEHRWTKVGEDEFESICSCEDPIEVLRSSGRLRLFGLNDDGEKEYIPIIRRRGDLQRRS